MTAVITRYAGLLAASAVLITATGSAIAERLRALEAGRASGRWAGID